MTETLIGSSGLGRERDQAAWAANLPDSDGDRRNVSSDTYSTQAAGAWPMDDPPPVWVTNGPSITATWAY